MASTKNIWDDSECVVEEEFCSTVSTNSPNETREFRNTLLTNKGDIKKAKKFSFDYTASSIEKESELSIGLSSIQDSEESVSDSMSSFDAEDVQFLRVKVICKESIMKARQASHRNENNWPKLSEEIKFMSSRKILSNLIV